MLGDRQLKNGGGGFNAAPKPPAFLQMRGVCKSFGSTRVLDDINLDVHQGEIIGLLGENGAGKSTTMNILSGALQADGGQIELEGKAVEFSAISDGIAAGIAFVHQELSVVGSLTVAENLFLGRLPRTRLGTVDFATIRREAKTMLENIGAGQINPRALAGMLRAGEQQLVEISKAAARNPRLLILDEPTSSLTPHEIIGFKDYVRRAAKAGTSTIFITHRLEEAMELCDRILILRNGAIVAERQAKQTNRSELIADMTGKTNLFEHRARSVTSTQVAVAANDLSDGDSVANVSFEVKKGEIFGLFGLIGAGRTETLEMICGARKHHQGTLTLFGQKVRFSAPHVALKNGISLVPEGRKTAGILPQHSVRRNASISSLGRFSVGPFMKNGREKQLFDRYANSLSIKMASDLDSITTLSGGNQQKVIFARAFMAEPKILLLDEPTHGVDVGAKAELYEIIRNAADEGLTVIVASSEIPEIIALCDRVAVLSKGKSVRVFEQSEMNEQELLESAFSGHDT